MRTLITLLIIALFFQIQFKNITTIDFEGDWTEFQILLYSKLIQYFELRGLHSTTNNDCISFKRDFEIK